MKLKIPLSIIKIFNYEYWAWWVFYLPMAPYWLYLAIRTRSLTFFTAANPGIEAGGFYGEKKMDILKNIRPDLLPKTIFIEKYSEVKNIHNLLNIKQLSFPIIAKPNVGERGTNVKKIENIEVLNEYHSSSDEDYIIQEFITFDIELGVLFSRLPNEPMGRVSSVTMKEFLTVTGDGKSTIEELVENSTRARFQLEVLRERLGNRIKEILKNGEKRLLEPIGNHCRGTKFVNANYLINSQLDEVFTEASQNFEGFFYGRFDMKVKSIEDLYAGKNIRIMELNGVSSDPGHIYDPNYHLWQAYRDLCWHWKRVADISIQNQKMGVKPLPFKEVWKNAPKP